MSRPPRPDARGLVMPPGRRIPRQPDPPAGRPAPPPVEGAEPPAGLAPSLAKAAGELAALATAVRGCGSCGRIGDGCVFGSGYPRADVMLLKASPSPQDIEAGAAFAAEAEPLGKAFAALGISASSLYGTTAVRCGDAPASSDELKACASHLLVEIEAVGPRALVAFGDRALEAVGALDGRCGIGVPDDVGRGKAVALRSGLVLLWTEALPDGVTDREAKRRLWRDLQTLPGMLGLR